MRYLSIGIEELLSQLVHCVQQLGILFDQIRVIRYLLGLV